MPEFLVPIANKPIVEHLVELLARHGIRDIIMVLKHMPYETEEYFGDGSRWGVRFSYSLQGSYEGPADSLRRIETMLGDVTVGADSRVDGGITVEKSQGISLSFSDKVPMIIVGPGASVRGPLRFEREVKLYVSDRATIGAVTGATPIPFAGDKPPG